jgi:NAD(P)H-quinone oxidoreductase subunit 5
MSPLVTLLPAIAAASLPLIARLMPAKTPRRRAAALGFAALGVLAVNAVVTALALTGGALRSPVIGIEGVGGSLLIDGVSAPVLLLIAVIGLVVISYSRNYLAGDPGQARFLAQLADTIALALLLVMSGNLALTLIVFVVLSLSLHRLLIFYPDRPAAQRAAAKKFVVSRAADLALLGAAVLLWRSFGTLEIADLASTARAVPAEPISVTVAMVLISLTALIKSAQMPLHGWLLEVMETPTPVSALLHAGIVNAGGYIAIRLADLFLASPVALDVLVTIGAATAILASLVMLTQTTIKGQLAYSTIAQMGFMLMQCGFGVFASALLHILSHSLYKAHAFLSAGGVVETRTHAKPATVGIWGIVAAVVVLLVAVAGLAVAVPIGGTVLFFAVLFLIGILPVAMRQFAGGARLRAIATFAGLAAAYAVLQIGMHRLTAGTLPEIPQFIDRPYALGVGVIVIVAFAIIALLPLAAVGPIAGVTSRALYVHLRNGLYLNTIANRIALALWPHKPSQSA